MKTTFDETELREIHGLLQDLEHDIETMVYHFRRQEIIKAAAVVAVRNGVTNLKELWLALKDACPDNYWVTTFKEGAGEEILEYARRMA